MNADNIDIAIPSVRLSVRDTPVLCCLKTAKRKPIWLKLFHRRIAPSFWLIAVTKFGRRSSLTEHHYWSGIARSRCVRGLSRQLWKIVTIADHSNQKLSTALAVIFMSLVTWQRPVWTPTDINAVKLAEFFVEKVEGVHTATAAVCSPWCISATSVKFPLRKCGKWWRVRLSKVPLSTETLKGVGWRLETMELYAPPVKNFWLRHCFLNPEFDIIIYVWWTQRLWTLPRELLFIFLKWIDSWWRQFEVPAYAYNPSFTISGVNTRWS